jgi:hypothetical protein
MPRQSSRRRAGESAARVDDDLVNGRDDCDHGFVPSTLGRNLVNEGE